MEDAMKSLVSALALVVVLGSAGSALAAPLALPWGGFEPYDANEGDYNGILCKSERQIRNILADEGYTHVLLGVVHDENKRVLAKADRNGVTWHIVVHSCTGKLIAKNPL
jgi:hypothetical protein